MSPSETLPADPAAAPARATPAERIPARAPTPPRQLTALDATFLALENDRNYGHVGSLSILDPSTAPDGRVDAARVRALIEERLHLLAPFRWKLQKVPFDLDFPYWVEDAHFDLGYHVREIALPQPGSMEQLLEQAGRIYSRRLDRARPLWELYVIHGLADGRVAMLTKTHHAAIDGVSGAEIMAALWDMTPDGRSFETPEFAPASAPGRRELLTRTAMSLPTAPINVARRAARLAPHLDAGLAMAGVPGTALASKGLSRLRRGLKPSGAAKVIERAKVTAPKGVYDAPVSPHRVFGVGELWLPDVKTVKDHFGVKLNDVVMELAAGALREDLIRRGRLPEDRSIMSMIPVSTRTPEERGRFGNEVSLMFVPIHTDVVDPVERLAAISETMQGAKERHGALPAKALRDVSQFLPGAIHGRAARALVNLTPRLGVQPPCNVVISNVPGPPIDLYTAGARVESFYPLSIISDGAAVNITVLSYRDRIGIGITADREQTPDVQLIVEGMQRELDRLVAIATADAQVAD